MRLPRDMTEEEIVAHLKFTEPWYTLGIMDAPALRLTVANFRQSDDTGDEHWRYGAFVYFMDRHPTLTPAQCEALFWLGAADPDYVMGTSIMLRVLDRPECPEHVEALAAIDERTRRYWGGYCEGVGAWIQTQRRRVAEGKCPDCGRPRHGGPCPPDSPRRLRRRWFTYPPVVLSRTRPT